MPTCRWYCGSRRRSVGSGDGPSYRADLFEPSRGSALIFDCLFRPSSCEHALPHHSVAFRIIGGGTGGYAEDAALSVVLNAFAESDANARVDVVRYSKRCKRPEWTRRQNSMPVKLVGRRNRPAANGKQELVGIFLLPSSLEVGACLKWPHLAWARSTVARDWFLT